MKKLGILFTTIVMLMLFAVSASAKYIEYSGDCGAQGDNLKWLLYDDGELVISGNGEMVECDDYFSPWPRSKIKRVVINDGTTNISDCAFFNCENIVSVIIPDSVEKIGDNAFRDCYNLASIRMGYGIKTIGSRAFWDCISLRSIIIPDDVTEIGYNAFCGCVDLYSVVIGESVETIGEKAFYYCDSLQRIVIGSKVTYIGYQAFGFCKLLKYIFYLGSSNIQNDYIGDDYFKNAKLYYSTLSNPVEPTCTSNGRGTYSGYTFDNQPYLMHKFSETTTEPTCTNDGEKKAFCINCDYYELETIKRLGHNMSEYTIIAEPTCSTFGVKELYCSRCTYSETSYIEMLSHTYDSVIKLSTCTESGYTTNICKNCNYRYITNYVSAKGHSHKLNHAIPPTHLTEGLMVFACECGDFYTMPVAKIEDHSYNETVTYPTCTTTGYTTYTCECGDTYVADYTSMISHSYSLDIIEPTCLKKGYNIYICSCGDNYTETIPATGHTFSGSVCTDCGYDKADTCSCNCHKSGLSALLWKILSIFYKLLSTNKVCACGTAHY